LASKKFSPEPKKSETKSSGARPKLRSSHIAAGKAEGGAPRVAKPRPKAKPATPARRAAAPSAAPSPAPAKTRSDSIMPSRRSAELKGEVAPRSKRTPRAESLASEAARTMAIDIAAAALEKKAVGLEVLDVAGRVDYADFLVLMTGRSDRQVAALAQGIEEAIRRKGKRALSVEGLPHANWVVMDFGDVVVHVFQEGARSTYDLDGLWMDARRVPVPNAQEN
jgi:ribosome-associated protein